MQFFITDLTPCAQKRVQDLQLRSQARYMPGVDGKACTKDGFFVNEDHLIKICHACVVGGEADPRKLAAPFKLYERKPTGFVLVQDPLRRINYQPKAVLVQQAKQAA